MITANDQLTVKELMSSPPITVMLDTSLRHVFKKMNSHKCRQLPVVQSGKLVGIITDRDMRLALNEPSIKNISWGNNARLDRLETRNFMTPNPTTVTPTTPAHRAANMLSVYKYGSLPVVENDKLVGIITVTDFLDYFVKQQPKVVLDNQ